VAEMRSDDPVNGYQIEDGIPPPSARGKANGITNVIRKLQIGQSVLFSQYKHSNQVSTLRRTVEKETGCKTIARKVDGGVRIWRLS